MLVRLQPPLPFLSPTFETYKQCYVKTVSLTWTEIFYAAA
jgi:hypothetical protein